MKIGIGLPTQTRDVSAAIIPHPAHPELREIDKLAEAVL